jgi:serine/threonine protein kinase
VDNVQKVQDFHPVGAVIQERYIVESLLGKGNFGSIYLVWDQHNKQKLFVLAEVIHPNEQESYRFTLEYVSPTPFRHQALPQVQYVFNDDKLSRAYLLMSYIEEPNLEKLRLQQSEKRFWLPQVMAMVDPVVNAVTYLHRQSPPVIHRNIQPAIIIPTNADRSVLVMLGIVKEYDSTTTTLHYLAPGYAATEQYREEYSARTDIYGLGATCYTLLTGIIPPDALYRSTQLSNGEIDPLKPLNEVIPTIPTFITEAIQRAMSINAHDRFPSVQQFEQALKADPRLQASSMLKSRLILPELDLSLKADSVAQKPVEPMIAPTGTTLTQTNPVEQQSPEPFIVPSVPTVQQAPVPEGPPLLAIAEEPPMPEVVSSTLANKEPPTPEAAPEVAPPEEPPVPEIVTPAIADREPSVAEVILSPLVAEEPPVPEVVPSAPTQSPVIPEKAVETPTESLPSQLRTVLSREPGTIRPASSRQTVEKPAPASIAKRPRAWKPGVLLIVLALLFGLGISAVIWSDIPSHPTAHSGAPTPVAKSPTRTPPTVTSIYPTLTGTYSGTIYDVSMGVSTSMSLTGIRQSQGNISGYLTLGPKLQGSGPFSGTIDTAKELKFTVTDTAGSTTLFFEGVMQSATSLTGDYYRCSSVGLSQGGRCRQAPGSYGIWSIVLTSSGQSPSFI